MHEKPDENGRIGPHGPSVLVEWDPHHSLMRARSRILGYGISLQQLQYLFLHPNAGRPDEPDVFPDQLRYRRWVRIDPPGVLVRVVYFIRDRARPGFAGRISIVTVILE